MGRTDYVVEGRDTCLLFLTADQVRWDRGPAVFGSHDGWRAHLAIPRVHRTGTTWICRHAVNGAHLGDRPGDDRPLPRFSPPVDRRLRLARRRPVVVVSFTPAPDIGQGNPPSLIRLADGRLCLTYGYRDQPFAIHARLSSDQGKTWTEPFVLRGDGGSQDIGYPRSVVRADGKSSPSMRFTTAPARYATSRPPSGIPADVEVFPRPVRRSDAMARDPFWGSLKSPG